MKKDGKIFEDICLLFDEMYLQKCEEYYGGEHIGSYENGELYKGIVYSFGFMIGGLKESIPCDQVISRNNNYRNYLNERRGTHLIFYLSEGALIWEGGGSFKPGRSLNFSAVKRGAHLKGAFIKVGKVKHWLCYER